MTKEQILKLIDGMEVYVPVYKIEEMLNMPPTTLQKVLSGKRVLPKKWDKPIEAFFSGKQQVVTLKDFNKQSVTFKDLNAPAPTTNFTINTTEQKGSAYMNDAIKKKLGII
jgi:uncharacterized protein YlzI (FlbEa/FlbD family)